MLSRNLSGKFSSKSDKSVADVELYKGNQWASQHFNGTASDRWQALYQETSFKHLVKQYSS